MFGNGQQLIYQKCRSLTNIDEEYRHGNTMFEVAFYGRHHCAVIFPVRFAQAHHANGQIFLYLLSIGLFRNEIIDTVEQFVQSKMQKEKWTKKFVWCLTNAWTTYSGVRICK